MCLIPCLWLCFAWIYVLICLLPCFMLRSASVHAYMLGFMFFHVYQLALTCSTCIAMPMPRSTFLHACMLGSRFSHAYISGSMFLHARVFRSLHYLLYAIFHVLVCSMPCLCAQTQAMFVLPCAIVPLLSLYLSFLCFGHVVRTRSRPYGLYLPCQPIQFQALLCSTPLAGCGCVVIFDAHEALFGCNCLEGIFVMPVASCIPLPFLFHVMICLPCLFAPPVGFLYIFTRLLACSCMSLACQCVVHASTQ